VFQKSNDIHFRYHVNVFRPYLVRLPVHEERKRQISPGINESDGGHPNANAVSSLFAISPGVHTLRLMPLRTSVVPAAPASRTPRAAGHKVVQIGTRIICSAHAKSPHMQLIRHHRRALSAIRALKYSQNVSSALSCDRCCQTLAAALPAHSHDYRVSDINLTQPRHKL